MTTYIVNETDAEGRPVGELSYPPGRRAGPGEACSDIPAASVKSLLARGIISPAPKPSRSASPEKEG